MVKWTKEEKFIVELGKIEQMQKEREGENEEGFPVDAEQIGALCSIGKGALAGICKRLLRGNYILLSREGEVSLTDHGWRSFKALLEA